MQALRVERIRRVGVQIAYRRALPVVRRDSAVVALGVYSRFRLHGHCVAAIAAPASNMPAANAEPARACLIIGNLLRTRCTDTLRRTARGLLVLLKSGCP